MKYTSLILSIVLCCGAWTTTETFSTPTAPATAGTKVLTELESKPSGWASSELLKKIDSVILLFLNDTSKDLWKNVHDELKRQLSTVDQNQTKITKDASDTCQNIECLLLALHADIVAKSETKDTVNNALSFWTRRQNVDLSYSVENIVKRLHNINLKSFIKNKKQRSEKQRQVFVF